jgi:hypothetical protein
MASDSTSRSTSTTSKTGNGADTSAGREAVQTAVAQVRGAVDEVGRQLPEVARMSRVAANDLYRSVASGTDERVSAGVTLSLGLAIGMLLGGANRLLIALALAPVAIMGLAIAERRSKGNRAAA